MKKTSIKFFDKIVVLLLGIGGVFGGNSCTDYGMPYAEYEIKGTVTGNANSQPIQNIRVIRQRDRLPEYGGDTLYTDSKGKYNVKFTADIYSSNLENTFHLKFEDIDGEENGGYFETQEIDVTFTKAERTKRGKGQWYEGKFVKTQNVEMEKKE